MIIKEHSKTAIKQLESEAIILLTLTDTAAFSVEIKTIHSAP